MIPVVIRPKKQEDGTIFQIHVGRESFKHQVENFRDLPIYTVRMETFPDNGFYMSSMHTSSSEAWSGAISTIFTRWNHIFEKQGVVVVYQLKNMDVLIEREAVVEDGIAYNWKIEYRGEFIRCSCLASAIAYAQDYDNLWCAKGRKSHIHGITGASPL